MDRLQIPEAMLLQGPKLLETSGSFKILGFILALLIDSDLVHSPDEIRQTTTQNYRYSEKEAKKKHDNEIPFPVVVSPNV